MNLYPVHGFDAQIAGLAATLASSARQRRLEGLYSFLCHALLECTLLATLCNLEHKSSSLREMLSYRIVLENSSLGKRTG